MKLIFIASAIYLLLTSCSSQSKMVKLYGYKQAVLPGNHSVYEVDEAGKQVMLQKKGVVNYLIYLTHPARMDVQPLEIWLNGAQYGIRSERANSPVEMHDDSPFIKSKTLLIPKTTDNVWLLTPTDTKPIKTFLETPLIAKSNQLVVVYQLNGKLHNQTLNKIKPLPTAVMQ